MARAMAKSMATELIKLGESKGLGELREFKESREFGELDELNRIR